MAERRDLRPLLNQLPHRYPNEVRVTFGSGIEYSVDADTGHFQWAWKSIDGTDLTEDEFVDLLLKLIDVKDSYEGGGP